MAEMRSRREMLPLLWIMLLCLACAALFPEIAAAASWSTPRLVSPDAQQRSRETSLAVAPRGRATLVGLHYHDGSPSVQVFRRRSDGVWTPPRRLSPIGSVSSPHATMGGDGTATVVWSQAIDPEGTTVVKASRWRPGGSWSSPVRISPRGGRAAQVRADHNGNVIAIWYRWVNGVVRVESAYRPAGGRWQPHRRVSRGPRDAVNAQVVVDRRGRAFAAWTADASDDAVLQSAWRRRDGTWTRPQRFAKAGIANNGVDLAVDAQGNATAIWTRRRDDGYWILETAVHPWGGRWTTPRRMAISYDGVGHGQVAVAPDGGAVAVWVRRVDGELPAHAARRTPGGKWLRVRRIAARYHTSSHLDVVIDRERRATAIWQDSFEGQWTTVTATQRPGEKWIRDARALAVAESASQPRIAATAAGDVTAVWASDNPSEPETWLWTARRR